MKKLRNGLIIGAIVIIIAHLTFIDYGNLTWSKNSSSYLGLISMILLIISMTGSIIYDKKQETKK